MKQPSIPKETVGDCMWEETHEMMQKWYNEIKHKIEKY